MLGAPQHNLNVNFTEPGVNNAQTLIGVGVFELKITVKACVSTMCQDPPDRQDPGFRDDQC